MKKLTRMLLIHWHNYEKEVLDFDMINFLTGKTAAGKSTIIDALQLVLLGDTSGSFFNKAANQKSARTLKSYRGLSLNVMECKVLIRNGLCFVARDFQKICLWMKKTEFLIIFKSLRHISPAHWEERKLISMNFMIPIRDIRK